MESGLTGGDRVLSTLARSRWFTPWGAAGVTLVAGFGVWAAWWVFVVARGQLSVALQGVERFLTGSLGDAFLLPTAAALTVVAYRRFAGLLDCTLDEHDPGLEVAEERVERILLGRLATTGPWLLSAAVVTWYHVPWIANPEFWARFAPASARLALVPAVYHALFMVFGVWWLLAFLLRLLLIGSIVLPAVNRYRGDSRVLALAALGAWRATLGLASVLVVFAVVLYCDRFGFTVFWLSGESHPEAVLCISLVPLVGGLLLWYDRAWIAPLRARR